MPGTVPAIGKVEDALKAALQAWPALSGQTIITDQSVDEAVTEDQYPAVLIYTVAYRPDVADENWMSLHEAIVEFEAVDTTQTIGTISRANHTTIAHILGCIAADRSLGGMLQDIQEIDVAPAQPNGRDVGSASLQCRVQFYTPREDWFTIKGAGGAEF